MFNLRKTAVAVLAVVSGTAFAGSMGPVCAPGKVTVPCERRAWDLSVFALYVQPNLGGDLSYYGFEANPSARTITHKAYDQWDWGFKLEAVYHFNTGNDLTVDWYHVDTDNTYVYPALTSNRLKNKWDGVNVELGQYSNITPMLNMRFHGGMTFARITSDNLNTTPAGITLSPATWNNTFSGVGPRAGIDMFRSIGNGLDLYAKSGAGVLVGPASFHDYSDTGQVPNYGNRNTVVPEFDARLGGLFTHPVANGEIVLDAGWMWSNYFQAQHKARASCDANYSISGPYLGINYVGNL